MVPVALPLAILLSSLMTYGNLGEHFELTAIKSAGISLTRTLVPIFFIVILLSIVAFYFNNNVVPKANLKAYSLLYDIRQKKPSLDFKEGAFYNGLPGYSIKVSHKYPDGKSLKNVMIYNHSQGRGNTDLIVADSGQMFMIHDDKYLVLELYNGKNYSEMQETGKQVSNTFMRNEFEKTRMVFSLASFELSRTKEELFATNKLMLNVDQLKVTVDSLRNEKLQVETSLSTNIQPYYAYYNYRDTTGYDMSSENKKKEGEEKDKESGVKEDVKIKKNLRLNHKKQEETKQDSVSKKNPVSAEITLKSEAAKDSAGSVIAANEEFDKELKTQILSRAVNQARSIKAYTSSHLDRVKFLTREANMYDIEMYRKFTQSIACLIMFLIGAPLGAIIKKGGLGVPVIISVVFFITFYVISLTGEKWAKEGVMPVAMGMWGVNFLLLPVGLFFLKQARNDSRLLESDSYIRIFKTLFSFVRHFK